jgi:hypothetical protein
MELVSQYLFYLAIDKDMCNRFRPWNIIKDGYFIHISSNFDFTDRR